MFRRPRFNGHIKPSLTTQPNSSPSNLPPLAIRNIVVHHNNTMFSQPMPSPTSSSSSAYTSPSSSPPPSPHATNRRFKLSHPPPSYYTQSLGPVSIDRVLMCKKCHCTIASMDNFLSRVSTTKFSHPLPPMLTTRE